MKVKELVRRLKRCDQDLDIVFYYLKDHDLKGCEYETLLEVDGRVELTIEGVTE